MPYLRDRIRWTSVRFPKILPEGFHFPASPLIKKLLYVGMVILSTLMFVMLGKTGYERYKENQLANERFRIRHAERSSLTPWDLPSVQQKMLDYLGDDYREIKPKAWNFPYIDDYVVFPGDYDLPESMQRGIKRKHLDMLYDIVRKKADTDKQISYLDPHLDDIRGVLDIPGLNRKKYFEILWGPASSSYQRNKFRYRYYDRPYKPKMIVDEEEDDDGIY